MRLHERKRAQARKRHWRAGTSRAEVGIALVSRSHAITYLLTGAVVISFAPVLVRLTAVDPTAAVFYRMVFGSIALGVMVLARRERPKLTRSALLIAFAAGFSLALDLALWHRAINLVGPGLATILANCQVFALAGFGFVALKESISIRYVVGTVVAVTGLFLIFGRNWSDLEADYQLGIIVGLLAAVAYAVFLILLRASQTRAHRLDPVTNMAIIGLVGALFSGASMTLTGESFAVPRALDWLILATYGVVMQGLAWIMISRALPHVAASRAGLILLLQPSLAFLWDLALFGRPTLVIEIIGATLAISGIYLGATVRRRETG